MRFPKSFVTGGGLANVALSGGALRVLIVLITITGDDSMATCTQTEVGNLAGLSRKSTRAGLDQLIAARIVSVDSARGRPTVYTVLPAYRPVPEPEKLAPSRANRVTTSPQANGTPEGYNSRPEMPPSEVATPKSLARTQLTQSTQHAYHVPARNALETIRRERSLPLSVTELMEWAYQIGDDGDPWDGYLRIKQATEASLTGSTYPAAVTRARLKALVPA